MTLTIASYVVTFLVGAAVGMALLLAAASGMMNGVRKAMRSR